MAKKNRLTELDTVAAKAFVDNAFSNPFFDRIWHKAKGDVRIILADYPLLAFLFSATGVAYVKKATVDLYELMDGRCPTKQMREILEAAHNNDVLMQIETARWER